MSRGAVFLVLVLAACGGTTAQAPKSATTRLPALPREGFVVQAGADIEFLDLRGHVLGRLQGHRLAPSPGAPLAVLHLGKRYVLDLRARRASPLPRNELLAAVRRARAGRCRVGPRRYLLCPRTVVRSDRSGKGAVVAGAPPSHAKIGHWEQAFVSPDGRTLLVQWSAECEIPITFVLASRGGPLRVVSGERRWTNAPESIALGFASDGRAMVLFPIAACGSGIERAGVYAVDVRTYARRFVLPVRRGAAVVMWGRTALASPP